MAAPAFTKHTVQDIRIEQSAIEAAVTGAPGGVVFDRRWHQDDYAELRVLHNTVSNYPEFSPWLVLSSQKRLATIGAIANMAWNATPPTAIPISPYAYSLPPNPPGQQAP